MVHLFETLDISLDDKLSRKEMKRGDQVIKAGVWMDVHKILKTCQSQMQRLLQAKTEHQDKQTTHWLLAAFGRFDDDKNSENLT